eukprot:UN00022
MGISQRDTLAVNLHDNSVSNRFPVIRQSKDPSKILPDGTFGSSNHFAGRLFAPFGPSVWAYPMVGQSPVDREAEKFLASWQNLDPTLFPTDKNFRRITISDGGGAIFSQLLFTKI